MLQVLLLMTYIRHLESINEDSSIPVRIWSVCMLRNVEPQSVHNFIWRSAVRHANRSANSRQITNCKRPEISNFRRK